jgi:hypothetical protein
MSSARRAAPPGGMAPPTTVSTPAGEAIELIPLAEEVTRRHLKQHPEDASRYGQDLAWRWCVHDMQHLLAWLARILDTRAYPVNNLFDCVLTAVRVHGNGASMAVSREPPGLCSPMGERMPVDLANRAGDGTAQGEPAEPRWVRGVRGNGFVGPSGFCARIQIRHPIWRVNPIADRRRGRRPRSRHRPPPSVPAERPRRASPSSSLASPSSMRRFARPHAYASGRPAHATRLGPSGPGRNPR